MKSLKEQAGFKNDGKYAVWGTKEAHVAGKGLDIITVTNNKREALTVGKQAVEEGWSHVQVRENKYSGYTIAILLDHGDGNFITV
jgi:hypothetical protein